MTNLLIQDDDIDCPILYCIGIILKEAREEDRLVKQILYTMLSAYTNNPINLAINAPSGEGKTYVIKKVGEKFPEEDVMFLAQMTEKAVFHRHGILVIRNERTGQYGPLDNQLAEIDSQIEDKELEIARTQDSLLKDGLRGYIKNLEGDKKELKANAKKLIDLSHKTLVFVDNPRPELFNALMPLLSHDRYEVEYEYVDTHNGIKTRSNVLRGWPAVIFAQAIDYSHYQRYPEIQRRFIITNPKMTAEKYSEAVELIGERFGLPDFAYQARIVSDSDKKKACEIVRVIREKMLEVSNKVEPDKNNVIIPFYEVLTKLLSKEKAFDMTTANRFFGFLSLLPIVNIEKRPRLVLMDKKGYDLGIIPFALFEDLNESEYLLRDANGVRPYILEWYNDVFLDAYNSKTIEDSKANSKGEELREKRIAVTTKELIEKTFDVRKKRLSSKQILQTYINPLINENYLDSINSEIDKRAHIYFPVLEIRNTKLFLSPERNNSSLENKIIITNSALNPNKQYLNSKIEEILHYSSDKDFSVKIVNHEEEELTKEDLVEQYYGNPEDYFVLR
jgi:hypothetical protein